MNSDQRESVMSEYTYVFVGGSLPIPVLVPVEVVVERMIASAERYRILSTLSARSAAQETTDASDDHGAPESERA